jgi:hypothetical protein
MPDAPLSPCWLPPAACGPRTLPCGRWFDAVLVRQEDGPVLLDALADQEGAVFADHTRDVHVWLVAPGTVGRWGRVARVRLLSSGRLLDVPAVTSTRWVRPPYGDCLTDGDVLLRALIELLKSRGLPHPLPPVRALRRCGCGALVVDGEVHACVRA